MGRRSDTWPEGTEERSTEWRQLIIRALSGSVYKADAEDVAQEMVLEMIRKARNGSIIHACPPRLPREFRQQALRIARTLSGGPKPEFLEWQTVEVPDEAEADAMIEWIQMQWIEYVFSRNDIDQMVEIARRGPFRLQDLAHAIGMPTRTFYSRLAELRSVRPS